MRRSRAGSKAGSARSEARAAPLAFMYVVGLSRRTGTPATSPSVTRARSPRRKGGNPQRATSASANQKPALCRVAAYSGPGLPRPTTARKRQLSLPPLGFSAFSVFSPLAGAAPPPPLASGLAVRAPPAPPPPLLLSPPLGLRVTPAAAPPRRALRLCAPPLPAPVAPRRRA